jgi:uncharacterized membrane protein YtjA (UPF0391 family)
MHRKAIFFLAAIFLVVALVVPPVLLILLSDHDVDNMAILQNPNGLQTNGNITISDEINESYQTYSIAAIIEVIFVVLFSVTLYYGINHPTQNISQQNSTNFNLRRLSYSK